MSQFDEDLRQLEATKANLVELEKLWNFLRENIPNGIPFRANPDYENACRSYKQLLTGLPLIDGWKPITLPCDLDEIAQSCLDILEIRELAIPIQVSRRIEKPGEELRDYIFRFNQKRQQFIRNKTLQSFIEIDELLDQLRGSFPIEEENIESGKKIETPIWQILRNKVQQIKVLLDIGSSVRYPPRWGDLGRHLSYGETNDLRDIINSDWPSVKESLRALLDTTNKPIPVDVNDLAELQPSQKAGIKSLSKLIDSFTQTDIVPEINENTLRQFLEVSQKAGVDVIARLVDWITTAAKVEDVVNVLEKLEVNDLQKLNAAVGLSNLKSVLSIWQDNQENDKEEFWHEVLAQNSFIFAQLFSFPVILLQDKAYVGGKSINNTGGNIIDFLFINNLTRNVALVEIKTPVTKLLGSKYRGDIYNISNELSGSVIQVNNYKNSLLQDYSNLIDLEEDRFNAFDPKSIVIIGNIRSELTEKRQRKSFELFRMGLKDVQVITYDELFAKVEFLVNLLEGNVTE
jgi:hypothetical protein